MPIPRQTLLPTLRLVAAGLAVLASVPVMAQSAPRVCPVPGETIQWIADFCMLKMQTDDEIAVSDCIGEHLKVKFPDDCVASLHFKRALCSLWLTSGGSEETLEQCVADPSAMGRTVRHGGVGGESTSGRQ